MSTPFDGVKALREEIEGLRGVLDTIRVTERRAYQRMGEAEVEYNVAAKLRGFAEAEIARKRAVLREIEK